MFKLLSQSFTEDINNIVIFTNDNMGLTMEAHSSLPIYTLRLHLQCTYGFNAKTLESEKEELPSDISETELLDMLTECMAIKLLKDKDS